MIRRVWTTLQDLRHYVRLYTDQIRNNSKWRLREALALTWRNHLTMRGWEQTLKSKGSLRMLRIWSHWNRISSNHNQNMYSLLPCRHSSKYLPSIGQRYRWRRSWASRISWSTSWSRKRPIWTSKSSKWSSFCSLKSQKCHGSIILKFRVSFKIYSVYNRWETSVLSYYHWLLFMT